MNNSKSSKDGRQKFKKVLTITETTSSNKNTVQQFNKTSNKEPSVSSNEDVSGNGKYTVSTLISLSSLSNTQFFNLSDAITLAVAIGLVVLIVILSCLLCCFQEGLGIKSRQSKQKEKKRQQQYQACLNQKTYAILPIYTKFNSSNLATTSDDMGTQLFVKEPLTKGNAGIASKVHSSESITRTKRVFSHLSLGIEKTFRKDFSFGGRKSEFRWPETCSFFQINQGWAFLNISYVLCEKPVLFFLQRQTESSLMTHQFKFVLIFRVFVFISEKFISDLLNNIIQS